MQQQSITPFLWFDTQAEDAARFYVSVFPNSRIREITHYGAAGPRPEGMVMTVDFELDGQRFLALNGGPEYTFDEAISFSVNCETQEEIDRYWELLTDGGAEIACGWLKDRYGLRWQIVPAQMRELIAGPDPEGARRATQAMMGMRKLDIAALTAARDGLAAAR